MMFNENIRALTVRTLVTETFFGMFYVVWQPFLIDIGTTLPQLGIVQGVLTLFAAVGSLLWGRLSDAWGRKPAVVASVLCRLVAMGFCLTAQSWVSFIGFGVFMGLSASWQQTNPAESSLIAESVDAVRVGTAISVYMSLGLVASMTTASIGGYLALNKGYWIIFLSCMAGETFNALFVSLRVRETLDRKSDAGQRASVDLRDEIGVLLTPEKELVPFYLINFIGTFSYGASTSILYALLVDNLGFNTVQLGLMSTLFGLSWGLTQVPVGWLMDRYGRKAFLLLAEVSAMVVMAGYILSKEFLVFLLLQIFYGLEHSMWIPAQIAMVAERVPAERRALAMGKLSTFPMLLAVPAPFIGGLLYTALGFNAPMILRLVAILASFTIILFFVHERSR